jgi:hypothetical protein
MRGRRPGRCSIAGFLSGHAAGFVYALAERRVRTLIDAVWHAVEVAVQGAAMRVDLRALRRVGAVIQGVGHAVAVGIALHRASACVDRRVRWGIRAVVHLVGHAVAIAIDDQR